MLSSNVEYLSARLYNSSIVACRELMFPFYQIEHRYWETNVSNNSLNVLIDLRGSLWNLARAGPFRLAGNTLHNRWSSPTLSIIA